jgi:hypothetical protein
MPTIPAWFRARLHAALDTALDSCQGDVKFAVEGEAPATFWIKVPTQLSDEQLDAAMDANVHTPPQKTHMRLRIKSSGGVTGIHRTEGVLDTTTYPDIEERFAMLKSTVGAHATHPDARWTTIEVTDLSPPRSIVIDESAVSPDVLDLLDDIRSRL